MNYSIPRFELDDDPLILDALCDYSEVLPIKVPGGWLILTGVGYKTTRGETVLSTSTVFVPDPEYKLDWENWRQVRVE